MMLKVIWSSFAERQLANIFNYYYENISEQVAKEMISKILTKTEKLSTYPFMGQLEMLLSERKKEYRYLVCSNYKIIYSLDEQNGYVKIVDVFDTRQNPIKLNTHHGYNFI